MNNVFLVGDPLNEMIESMKDLSFRLSGPTISSLIVMSLVAIFAIIVGIQAATHDPLKPTKGPLFLAEAFYEWVENWSRGIMGHDPRDMVGYFFCLFVYLFLAFNWSLTGFPGIIDFLVLPLSLSIVMFILIQVTALRYQKFHYFHRYIEPVPIWLPINLLTMWTPIISTSLRMFGNALAGSVVIGLINWAMKNASMALFSFMGEAGQIFLGPIPIGILNLYFGLFSGFIQTLVFASLNAVWIGQEMPGDDAMGLEKQAVRAKGNKQSEKAI